MLLARFNDHKHMFTGTETSSIALVRSAVIATGQEHGIENRVIRITPYVMPQDNRGRFIF